MNTNEGKKSAAQVAEQIRIGATRSHIFMCTGKPDGKGGCCNSELGEASWKRLKEASAAINTVSSDTVVQRSAVKCLRLCAEGPIAVVYPEGVWYRECHGENLEQIIESHLNRGEVVERLRISPAKD